MMLLIEGVEVQGTVGRGRNNPLIIFLEVKVQVTLILILKLAARPGRPPLPCRACVNDIKVIERHHSDMRC